MRQDDKHIKGQNVELFIIDISFYYMLSYRNARRLRLDRGLDLYGTHKEMMAA